MNNSITSGKMKQFKGKTREKLGKLTGNKSQEIKGKVEHATGHVQEQYGKAKKS
jgi:uncharacterized protein YjbJ (UPF0337 family)